MKLPAKLIDSNVIIHFFIADNEEQTARSRYFFEALEAGRDEALLCDITFAEVVWVLQKYYAVPRAEIAGQFSRVISCLGLKTVFKKDLYLESLTLFANTPVDIQDALLAVLARNADATVITFDTKDFKKLSRRFAAPEGISSI